ncbi:hypothetical protein EUZ85_16690 [Hahella sp. KA22]|uniref:Z1 domain-containing protein n=1 Tax=Hahella sp. KA22 TaxID=1628392 RepID=UPI000FDE08F8|nr:Z1 domain-containing protein [Hahella sp. KA22]AZZ92275.1 hypothetical protein ENC22_14125 [Hahella sp. KA22]QAY55646.1 hypothetical protein EUZ85_16690 [Hahella sp. KA22]
MGNEFVDMTEIAKMATCSESNVQTWRLRSADFPRPIDEGSASPKFRKIQIDAWLIRNKQNLEDLGREPDFYHRLMEHRKDSEDLSECIQKVVDQLEGSATSDSKPGILLGKIQSGKTRAFIGVVASSFDKGFDISIILTKGTRTLSEQTVKRLCSDFSSFIEKDEIIVLDIMKLPGKMTQSELRRKIVIVAKKQKQNLIKLIDFLITQGLQKKKVLIVDDEADLASVRFIKKKGGLTYTQGTIADQIDQLREISSSIAYLQVTATPYSLYLQPDNYQSSMHGRDYIFKPKRPAFTELLPIHSGYVGGDDYFGDFDTNDPRSKLFVEVSNQEQDALRKPDHRRIKKENILETPNTLGIRRAIATFIIASGIRQWQQRSTGESVEKYSMIIHNDVQRAAHSWQDQVIDWIFQRVSSSADKNPDSLREIFNESYLDLQSSVTKNGGDMPSHDDCFCIFIDALQSEEIVVEKVNSDNDVMALLDEKAELKLRTPYNIFVGGNILDRGITIPNLISFYYGRNPRTMQADTVLQHSRMYGNRTKEDLAVTRLYTSRSVYDRLFSINEFENTLRDAFENKAHDQGVVFIQIDDAKSVIPCAPNKVQVSHVVTVSPTTLLLPSGFDTIGGSVMAEIQRKLNLLIKPEWRDTGNFTPVSEAVALKIISLIEESMSFNGTQFEWNAMRGLLRYYSEVNNNADGEILLLAETGRELTKVGSGNKSGRSILGIPLREKVINTPRQKPALVLLQQKGGLERGWSAHSFWWPILAAPTDSEPCIFATKTAS